MDGGDDGRAGNEYITCSAGAHLIPPELLVEVLNAHHHTETATSPDTDIDAAIEEELRSGRTAMQRQRTTWNRASRRGAAELQGKRGGQASAYARIHHYI